LSEARFEIVEKEFDLSLIDNRPKLNDLIIEIETQEEIVMAENEKGLLYFCGFRVFCIFSNNQINDLQYKPISIYNK